MKFLQCNKNLYVGFKSFDKGPVICFLCPEFWKLQLMSYHQQIRDEK